MGSDPRHHTYHFQEGFPGTKGCKGAQGGKYPQAAPPAARVPGHRSQWVCGRIPACGHTSPHARAPVQTSLGASKPLGAVLAPVSSTHCTRSHTRDPSRVPPTASSTRTLPRWAPTHARIPSRRHGRDAAGAPAPRTSPRTPSRSPPTGSLRRAPHKGAPRYSQALGAAGDALGHGSQGRTVAIHRGAAAGAERRAGCGAAPAQRDERQEPGGGPQSRRDPRCPSGGRGRAGRHRHGSGRLNGGSAAHHRERGSVWHGTAPSKRARTPHCRPIPQPRHNLRAGSSLPPPCPPHRAPPRPSPPPLPAPPGTVAGTVGAPCRANHAAPLGVGRGRGTSGRKGQPHPLLGGYQKLLYPLVLQAPLDHFPPPPTRSSVPIAQVRRERRRVLPQGTRSRARERSPALLFAPCTNGKPYSPSRAAVRALFHSKGISQEVKQQKSLCDQSTQMAKHTCFNAKSHKTKTKPTKPRNLLSLAPNCWHFRNVNVAFSISFPEVHR